MGSELEDIQINLEAYKISVQQKIVKRIKALGYDFEQRELGDGYVIRYCKKAKKFKSYKKESNFFRLLTDKEFFKKFKIDEEKGETTKDILIRIEKELKEIKEWQRTFTNENT